MQHHDTDHKTYDAVCQLWSYLASDGALSRVICTILEREAGSFVVGDPIEEKCVRVAEV